ncbi:Uma2 family endonuclease [Streptomyces atratus]|uniref:Uma2 family endonuclease n=1 Tax=Streptomyces atratus TaxID=1893 RepID=UPI0021A48BCC|nr:Uma2 family endonuclease [Streptomyces atratus]MCT2543402.1 Uma2 family endonuclease [Streptomyces atratus]
MLSGAVEFLEAIHVTLPSGPVVPDNMVADAGVTVNDGVSIDIEAVQLVVELVSPGNKAMGQKFMPMLYAKAANPHCWRLEFDPAPGLIITELENDRYVEQTIVLSGEAAWLDTPFAVDLAGLARQ